METSYRALPLMSEHIGDLAIVLRESNLLCAGGAAGRNTCCRMTQLPRQWEGHIISSPKTEGRGLGFASLWRAFQQWEHSEPSVSLAAVSFHQGWLLAWTREVSCLKSQSLRFFFSPPFMCVAFFQVHNAGSGLVLCLLSLRVSFQEVAIYASGCTRSPVVRASRPQCRWTEEGRAVLSA